MVDGVLAGLFFTPIHIAAIGIVLPVRVLLSSVLQIIIQGTYAGYTAALARGQRRPSVDKLLRLDKGQCADYPMIDIYVHGNDKDISRVSERIQRFLEKENISGRTAYMTALCIDELATDLKEHSRQTVGTGPDEQGSERLLALKIVSEGERLTVMIFNPGEPYDPLDFEYSNDDYSKIGLNMVQRVAEKIDYAYIYKMNMITIRIAK